LSNVGNGITIVGADGRSNTVLRTDVDELTSTGKSAMPEGLENDLRPQDVADIIAFIRSNAAAPKPKVFDGNTPALVRPGPDGSLLLAATTCEIRGKTLQFEEQYSNLGHWSSDDDSATWTFVVPQAGKYTVWLDYACEKSTAGNSLALETGSQRLTTRIESTGDWDTYRNVRIGIIELPAGEQRLTVRAAGPLRGSLIDLRSIQLKR
jgi:hypothetical protein